MIGLYRAWMDTHPIVSIEDGLDENDWQGFTKMTAAQGNRLQIVGDDIFVTDPAFVRRGIREKAANAVLPGRPDGASSFRTGQAKPRTPSWPISRSPWGVVRSRPGPPAAASGLPSTEGCLKLRNPLVLPPYSNPHSNWHKRRETDF
jgi:hypothetical protein